MPGYRYRNMYYATGLPGWMRFGYSPGWGGLPPAAQFLMQMGMWPGLTKEQERRMLEDQAEMLRRELERIEKRLEELKEE